MTTENAIVGRLIKVGGILNRVLACAMLPPAAGRGWTFVLLGAREPTGGELSNITIGEDSCRLVDEPAWTERIPYTPAASMELPDKAGGPTLTGEDLARMTRAERSAAIGDVVNGVMPQPGAYAAAAELFAPTATPAPTLTERYKSLDEALRAIENIRTDLAHTPTRDIAAKINPRVLEACAELAGCIGADVVAMGSVPHGVNASRELVELRAKVVRQDITIGDLNRAVQHAIDEHKAAPTCVLDGTDLYRFPRVIAAFESEGLKPDTAEDLAAAVEWALGLVKLKASQVGTIYAAKWEQAARDAQALIATKDTELAHLRECVDAADRTMGEQAAEIQRLNQALYDAGEKFDRLAKSNTGERLNDAEVIRMQRNEIAALRSDLADLAKPTVDERIEAQKAVIRALREQLTTATAVPTILPELFENSVELPDGRLCWQCTDGSFVPVSDDGRAPRALHAWGARLVAERNQARATALALQKRIDDFTATRPVVTSDPMREGAPTPRSNGSLAERLGAPRPPLGIANAKGGD